MVRWPAPLTAGRSWRLDAGESDLRGSDDFSPFASSRRRAGDAAAIVALFAMTRAILVAAGVLAWSYQVSSYPWRGRDRSGVRFALAPRQPLLDMWARWDSWEYEEIAREGYWYDFRHQ